MGKGICLSGVLRGRRAVAPDAWPFCVFGVPPSVDSQRRHDFGQDADAPHDMDRGRLAPYNCQERIVGQDAGAHHGRQLQGGMDDASTLPSGDGSC